MGQVPRKHPIGRAGSKADRVEVAVRDRDRGHIQALIRALDANDAAAHRLRAEIEQILADETGSVGEALVMPSRGATRH